MTDHRPWFRVWRAGVPKTVAPFPRQSVFNLLVDSAAGFPESTAIAFLGKHLNYRELLQEVERFSAVLAGLGVKRGRPGRPAASELTPVRDRVVRVPAARRRGGRQQPALHPARARAPDQGPLAQRDGRPRPALPRLGGRRERGAGPRGDRHQAHGLHAVPAQPARAHQVQEGREEGGEAVAPGPGGREGPMVEAGDGDRRARRRRWPRSTPSTTWRRSSTRAGRPACRRARCSRTSTSRRTSARWCRASRTSSAARTA